MANEFLIRATDAAGNVIYTASDKHPDGKPTTRVHFDAPQPVQLSGSIVTDVTLQNAVTVAGNGTAFTVGGHKTLTLKITGSSTSRTIYFEAAGSDGVYESIQGLRVKDYLLSGYATANNESWQVDITGFKSFRARVSAVSGGDVTVKGTAVV